MTVDHESLLSIDEPLDTVTLFWGWETGVLTLGSWRWTVSVPSLGWRSIDHEKKAFLCRGKFRDVMLRMGSPDVFLHGTISLLL